jgi:hypothetical protein
MKALIAVLIVFAIAAIMDPKAIVFYIMLACICAAVYAAFRFTGGP